MNIVDSASDASARENAQILSAALVNAPESPLLEIINETITLYSAGRPFTVVAPNDSGELSASEAAQILGVSRPTLYKLLDAGALPFRKVGTHRRILLEDVHVHMARRNEDRRRFAEDISGAVASESAQLAALAGVDVETLHKFGY